MTAAQRWKIVAKSYRDAFEKGYARHEPGKEIGHLPSYVEKLAEARGEIAELLAMRDADAMLITQAGRDIERLKRELACHDCREFRAMKQAEIERIKAERDRCIKDKLAIAKHGLEALADAESAKREALEAAASACRGVYKAHRNCGQYPMDMGGLALECEEAIRALMVSK